MRMARTRTLRKTMTITPTTTATTTITSPSRRLLGSRAAELITTGLLVRVRGAVLDGVRRRRLHASRRARSAVALDRLRRSAGRLVAARRYADRGHAGRGHHDVLARPPLFHRLHGRGPVPAALLRLSVAVHLRDADAGDRGQSRAAVLRLGGRRSHELPADRLLVPEAVGECRGDQGVRRQPRRRFRLRARHLRRLHAARIGRVRDRSLPARRGLPARPSISSAGMPMR